MFMIGRKFWFMREVTDMRWALLLGFLLASGVLIAQEAGQPGSDDDLVVPPPGPGGKQQPKRIKPFVRKKLVTILQVDLKPKVGVFIHIEGTSRYPDGTRIAVSLRYKGQQVTGGIAKVVGGKWSIDFYEQDFGDRRFWSGNYEVEASVKVRMQPFLVRDAMKKKGVAEDDRDVRYKYIGSKPVEERETEMAKAHYLAIWKPAKELLEELVTNCRKAMWKFENRYMGKELQELLESPDKRERAKAKKRYRWYWKWDRKKHKWVFDSKKWREHHRHPDYGDMFEFYTGERFDWDRWFGWLCDWTKQVKRLLARHRSWGKGYVVHKYPEAYEAMQNVLTGMLAYSHAEVQRIFNTHSRYQKNLKFPTARERARIMLPGGVEPPPSSKGQIKKYLAIVDNTLDLRGLKKSIIEQAKALEEKYRQERKKEEQQRQKQKSPNSKQMPPMG